MPMHRAVGCHGPDGVREGTGRGRGREWGRRLRPCSTAGLARVSDLFPTHRRSRPGHSTTVRRGYTRNRKPDHHPKVTAPLRHVQGHGVYEADTPPFLHTMVSAEPSGDPQTPPLPSGSGAPPRCQRSCVGNLACHPSGSHKVASPASLPK